jgi:hypothetical protein
VSSDLQEEIALIERLISDSEQFSKNKSFTKSHREACAAEHIVFKRILARLKKEE